MPKKYYIVGCHTRAKEYLDERNMSSYAFAKLCKFDPGLTKQYIDGHALPGLVAAFKMEYLTQGGIPVESWLSTDAAKVQWQDGGLAWDAWRKAHYEEKKGNEWAKAKARTAQKRAARMKAREEANIPAIKAREENRRRAREAREAKEAAKQAAKDAKKVARRTKKQAEAEAHKAEVAARREERARLEAEYMKIRCEDISTQFHTRCQLLAGHEGNHVSVDVVWNDVTETIFKEAANAQ